MLYLDWQQLQEALKLEKKANLFVISIYRWLKVQNITGNSVLLKGCLYIFSFWIYSCFIGFNFLEGWANSLLLIDLELAQSMTGSSVWVFHWHFDPCKNVNMASLVMPHFTDFVSSLCTTAQLVTDILKIFKSLWTIYVLNDIGGNDWFISFNDCATHKHGEQSVKTSVLHFFILALELVNTTLNKFLYGLFSVFISFVVEVQGSLLYFASLNINQ